METFIQLLGIETNLFVEICSFMDVSFDKKKLALFERATYTATSTNYVENFAS